jgi:hypothetical protein
MGEIGHQLTSDPATFLCGILDQASHGGQACNTVQKLLAKQRPSALPGSAGRAARSGVARMDPTLGGLVEAGR